MPLPVRLELSALTAYIVLSQVRLDVQFTSTAGEVEGDYSHSVAAVWLESQTKIKGPTYFFTFPSVKGKPYLWEAGTYRFTFMVVSCYIPFRSVLGLHPFLISVAAERLVRTIIVAPLLFFLGRILFPSVRLPSFMYSVLFLRTSGPPEQLLFLLIFHPCASVVRPSFVFVSYLICALFRSEAHFSFHLTFFCS